MPDLFTKLFLLFVLGSASDVALAAKMYKWVDENGEVHFSQTPPIQDESSVPQDQIEIQTTSGSVLVPTIVDGQPFCGELKLPMPRDNRQLSSKTLNEKIKYWSQ
ncbi:MAG: DUF4124 domain-containing protein, partial [Sedimenticola sp.]|nr:DUF4124 domain-containing protein [Sedimenticola sp.]